MSDRPWKVRRYNNDVSYPEVPSSSRENHNSQFGNTGDERHNIASALPVGVNEMKHNYHVRRFNLDVSRPGASSYSQENQGRHQVHDPDDAMNNIVSAYPGGVHEFNKNHLIGWHSRNNQGIIHQFGGNEMNNLNSLNRPKEFYGNYPELSPWYIKNQKEHQSQTSDEGNEKFTDEILRKEQIILYTRKNFTKMTTDLLRLHFSPEILMTHSLLGPQGPSFQNQSHPARLQLDPVIVGRIEEMVGTKFKVSRALVRSIIASIHS